MMDKSTYNNLCGKTEWLYKRDHISHEAYRLLMRWISEMHTETHKNSMKTPQWKETLIASFALLGGITLILVILYALISLLLHK